MQLRALVPVFALSVFANGCALAAKDAGDDEGSAGRALARVSSCTIRDTVAPGSPRVLFAPFDPVEDEVLCALDGAESEVLVAHYNIRSQRVLDKLVELHRRGVTVRVAVDAKNAQNEWNVGDDLLESAGVPVVRFPSKGIMHLKVAVIDRAFAMTGSFNWNETASTVNDENMIAFRDPELVARYHEQVLELLGDRARTVAPAQATPWAQVHFAPERAVDAPIVKAIDAAKTSVDVAMFTFTMRSLSDALVRAQNRGVRVRLVVERKQQDLSDAEDRVEAAGATVIRAANRLAEHSAMHQKYAVIDGARVITGATNWTFSGTRTNEEDLLILDVPAIAQAYARNFADLLHVYARVDEGAASVRSPVVFRGVHGATAFGDTVVVVGSDPALGAWNPWAGVPMGGENWPDWSTRASLPAGAHVEWKLVTIEASGEVVWEPGANRVLDLPASGRAVVVSGAFGDTSKTWTPADEG